MKNLSLILNVVLLLAVSFLYVEEYVLDDDGDGDATATATADDAPDLALAYINSDTLLARYRYYEEVSDKLEKKKKKLQQEYARRAEGLQKQFEDYQRTATNMTIGQARAVEEDLTRKRQNLLQYQETITQELMKEEAAITQELYDKVASYLKTYGEENNLQIVFTYSASSSLIYANEGLDITNQVIEGLNALHEGAAGANAADSTAVN